MAHDKGWWNGQICFSLYHIWADQARHTGTAIEARVGPPVTHVEAVKLHAFEIRRHLQALAALAHKDDELNSAIQGFFGEAFFNLLGIMTECQKEMPQSEEASEIGVQIIAPSRKMEEASSLGSG